MEPRVDMKKILSALISPGVSPGELTVLDRRYKLKRSR